ncbi:MAG: tRNA 4-thiouridine(8) synthase ThiI [Oscillospiraceae bacterium]|nr:tRNA 4-thiouridine(8) synthase ThiI [Oscillospiraceae bacterium]
MDDVILLKLGELVLKGLNRRNFEDRLLRNIRRRLEPYGTFRVSAMQSTVYVEPLSEASDLSGAYEALKTVFGIAGMTLARSCAKTVSAMTETAKTYLNDILTQAKSFKAESRRADKSFPLTSIQLSQQVGGALHDAFPHLAVDVHRPEVTVYLEVRETAAFVHTDPEPGAGGLPAGINGRAVTLLSGGIDSPVSSYMIAKRGIELIPVHFFSYPYTSLEAKEKVLSLARILTRYCGRMTVSIVPFTRIQEEIRKNCPEEYFTLIMRRFMMRIAQNIAEQTSAKALVTGESLGQVASQTMEALRVTEDACEYPVLRPLIGMDKEEIVAIARKIGTFSTSILPYEDCCTVFTPRHPKTKPRLPDVRKAEAALDTGLLIQEALAATERMELKL